MTVITETNGPICQNHEIGTSRNYIINRRDALLNATKNKMWIDTDERNHMVTYDDEDVLIFKNN